MGLSVALPAKEGFGNPMSPNQQKRYPNIQFSQFMGAEMMAAKYGLTKDQLDEYAYNSHQRAIAATQGGAFRDEIIAVDGRDGKGDEGSAVRHDSDEGIRYDSSLDAIKGVKLLREGGAITAATSSQICDGASGVMVVSEKALKEHGLTPLARIHNLTLIGHDPVIMLEAPLPATERALKKAGMSIDDIDLFEVNEAFASVPVAWLKSTGADPAKMNVNGGAIALGHPLGASGTKLMTTLLHALKARDKKWGLQTMCEGGGLANVTIVERL
jgi:acetyl-CoA C-acetyltransferase